MAIIQQMAVVEGVAVLRLYVLVRGFHPQFCSGAYISMQSSQGFSLFFPVQEVAELRQQLQSSEREKEMYRQQLTRKEAEQTRREEETIRSKQQVR